MQRSIFWDHKSYKIFEDYICFASPNINTLKLYAKTKWDEWIMLWYQDAILHTIGIQLRSDTNYCYNFCCKWHITYQEGVLKEILKVLEKSKDCITYHTGEMNYYEQQL